MRLFIAIPFSEKTRRDLEEVMKDLKRQGMTGNFTDPRNLHLTLVFFGETERAEEIRSILRSVPFPAIRFSFDRTGHFGNLYWIGIRKNEALEDYVRTLRAELDRYAIPYDRKAFRPHITLVRKAHWKEAPRPVLPKRSFRPLAPVLFRSDRVNGRIRYTPVRG